MSRLLTLEIAMIAAVGDLILGTAVDYDCSLVKCYSAFIALKPSRVSLFLISFYMLVREEPPKVTQYSISCISYKVSSKKHGNFMHPAYADLGEPTINTLSYSFPFQVRYAEGSSARNAFRIGHKLKGVGCYLRLMKRASKLKTSSGSSSSSRRGDDRSFNNDMFEFDDEK
jgi:hypothetical protein